MKRAWFVINADTFYGTVVSRHRLLATAHKAARMVDRNKGIVAAGDRKLAIDSRVAIEDGHPTPGTPYALDNTRWLVTEVRHGND